MGGNIFKDFAEPIERKNIRPTINRYIQHLGYIFPRKAHVFQKFVLVGSAGKKEISGDLDIAFDLSAFFDGEPFNENELRDYKIFPEEFTRLYNKIKSRARTSTDEMCKLKAFLKLISWPISHEGMIHVADGKTTTGNIFTMFPQYNLQGQLDSYVQIDWMVGDPRWTKFSYHSGESGDLKGLHRTQLMVAMLSNKGYTFSHLHGIKIKKSQEFVATKPSEAVELFNELFGPMKQEDFHSFIRLHGFLREYTTDTTYNEIINSYLNILKSCRAEIPNILKEFGYESS
jgi:hypothetical protein